MSPDPPMSVEEYAGIEPVYEELPGWRESTVGVTSYEALPVNARRYLGGSRPSPACPST